MNQHTAKTIALAGAAGLLLATAAAMADAASSAGTVIDDTMITAKIKSSLVADPQTKARRIAVKTHDGMVELSGHVDSLAAKQRAQQIASETGGVSGVHNVLVVDDGKSTIGEKVDDSVLAGKVKAALVGDPATKAREIKVRSLRDVVQLSGFVDSEEAKMAAARVAASVDGVKDVRNDLLVKAP